VVRDGIGGANSFERAAAFMPLYFESNFEESGEEPT
jgi:hypothetical protein